MSYFPTEQNHSSNTCGTSAALPILDRIWEDVVLDFFDSLPNSGWHDTILVVVDWLSKFGSYYFVRKVANSAKA